MKPFQRIMPGVVATLLFCAAAVSAEIASEQRISFNIPPQSLGQSLRQFGEQTGLQVVVYSQASQGLTAPPLTGQFSPRAALSRLLENTGLHYEYLNAETVAILSPSSADASESGASILRMGDALAGADFDRDNVRYSGTMRLAQAEGATSSAAEQFSSEADSDSVKLEEILVIARRKEEKAQTVPVAITVVSQQALKDNNVTTLAELQYLVPSLSGFSDATADTMSMSIRGQGQSATTSQPGVIAYMNEVPVTNSSGGLNAGPGLLFDLENVQVLKGPQGTLFGRNSAGGALLLQSARPTNELGGRMQVGFGNYNNREVDGAVNLPIASDVLLTRVAFAGQWRDGFTRLQADPSHPNGRDVNDRDTWSVRGTVAFHPGGADGRFQSDTTATYTEYSSRGSPNFITDVNPNGFSQLISTLISPTFTYADALAQQRALPTDVHTALDTDIGSDSSSLLLSNKSTFALTDKLSLRNILGYNVAKSSRTYDSDSTILPIFEVNAADTETVRQFTEELQLLGQSFGDRLDWMVGAFYLEQPLPDEFVHNVSTVFAVVGEGGSKRSEKGKAVFTQGTYNLLANLKATVGVRYTEDERFSCGYTGPRANAACGNVSEASSNALTWTWGFDYQATPDTLLYLASRRGYRAGGSNGVDPVAGRLPDFDPEYVTDYELGLKADWEVAQVPIRTNAAVYYQDYSDIQVQTFAAPPVGVFLTDNAAAARLWGVELEALAQLTANLQFGVTYDHLDFKYTEFDAGVAADQQQQLAFKQKTNRPPNKYGLSARYRLPVASTVGEIVTQANWNWQAASGDRDQAVGAPIDAFGLLNLAINWNSVAGQPLDISLYGSNVLDKEYATGGFGLYSSFGAVVLRYGEPRMYGVRLRYRFGADGE